MWSRKRLIHAAETRALLARLRSKGWKTEAEREETIQRVSSIPGLEAEDIAWLAVEQDTSLSQAGLTLLRRFPYETAAEALFPFLAQRAAAIRQATLQALEALAGTGFPEKMQGYFEHPDSAVVYAALDYARRNPSERYLPGVEKAFASSSPFVRRKAFRVLEALSSPRAAAVALKMLEDDDEELRYRSIQVLSKQPEDAHIGPLLKRCHYDSARVQDAAIAALGPLLARADTRWHEEILALLSDLNPKVCQLALRILKSQSPEKVVEGFIKTYWNTFGLGRDRALGALRELGPRYIQAFLDRDDDPDPKVAAIASSIAVTIRSPEVVPHCIRFLESDDWWLRDRAAQALAEIRDERALPPLLKMLSDSESNLSAAAALGVWGTPQALPALLEAFKKGTKDLRLEILDAFTRTPDPRVGVLLESIVKADPDPLVKEKAARLAAAGQAGNGQGAAQETAVSGPRVFSSIDWGANPNPTLPDLLRHARAAGASDLHLASGTVPHLRVNGRLVPLPMKESQPERIEAWIVPILGGERGEDLARGRQIDFCHKDTDLGRFRTNVFYQRKGLSAVFRLIPEEIPNLTDIGLPESAWDLTTYSQGLVLVTGPSGCGKTTTLAALVDRINQTQRAHIVTIEDPIEYVHPHKESLVNQREIPSHSSSFAKALRQSLREDPDVILVGEMRDLETISLAITASETGHLVLGTLHTTTASSTVDRVINAFPPEQQGQIRLMIADSLKAVISQALLPRRDGSGRVAAYEILRNTPAVAGLVREAKTFQLPTVIQTGTAAGMTLMDGALLRLVQEGVIEPRVAYDHALRKEAFEPFLAPEEAGAA